MKKLTLLFLCIAASALANNRTLSVDENGNAIQPVNASGTPIPFALPDVLNRTPNEIWISANRSDGKGQGTQLDPFDGSTRAKFDAILAGYYNGGVTNLHVHLGPTTTTKFLMQISPDTAWHPLAGWTIEGAGMDATVLQADPATNLSGIEYSVGLIVGKNNSAYAADGFELKNLTLDCNWSAIGATADNGAGGHIFTDGKTISGSPNITSSTAITGATISTSANQGWGFAPVDVFRFVAGSGIPMTAIGTITSGSNGVAMSGTYTINVTTTTGTPAAPNQIIVASGAGSYNVVTYAGKTSNTFTGCIGGTGNMATGGAVSLPSTTITKIPATTVAAASDGATLSGVSTLTVTSAADFYGDASHGGIGYILDDKNNPNSFTYTGKTSTTLTGFSCSGSGTIHTGFKVSSNNQAVISANATATASSVSITIGGQKKVVVYGADMAGSGIRYSRVKCTNPYGSTDNGFEMFALVISSTTTADGVGNVISECVPSRPQGDYGSPFALFGIPPYNCRGRVTGCRAYGINNGLDGGFSSGGVNLAYNAECEIDGNYFEDCFGVAYHDTGWVNGLKVHDNKAMRCWQGFSNFSAASPEDRIEVYSNTFDVQNRIIQGASYGVVFGSAASTNAVVQRNVIRKNTSGFGYAERRGITDSALDANSWIRDNIVTADLSNQGTTARYVNNVSADGTDPGLPDRNHIVGLTVATLPASPTLGATAVVTDGASSLAMGATVTAGGSSKYGVVWNGSAWTIRWK